MENQKKITISISGEIGSGKDTAADFITQYITNTPNFSVTSIAYAAHLKNVCSLLVGCDIKYFYDRDLKNLPIPGFEQYTPRSMMTFIGTDLMTNQFDSHIWINRVSDLRNMHDANTVVVITDTRSFDEVASVKEMGGVLLYIDRPDNPHPTSTTSSHSSEASITREYAALNGFTVIKNDGTLDDLRNTLEKFVESLLSPGV